MLIHTSLVFKMIDGQLTPHAISLRTSYKHTKGKRTPAHHYPYNPGRDPFLNHVAAVDVWCRMHGVSAWFVYTQETAVMYRFTEAEAANTVHAGVA